MKMAVNILTLGYTVYTCIYFLFEPRMACGVMVDVVLPVHLLIRIFSSNLNISLVRLIAALDSLIAARVECLTVRHLQYDTPYQQ